MEYLLLYLLLGALFISYAIYIYDKPVPWREMLIWLPIWPIALILRIKNNLKK